MQRLTGFEFLIELPNGDRSWVKLQGSGGLIGSGTLSSLNHRLENSIGFESALMTVLHDNTKRARAELRKEGTVRVWTDHEDPAKRITPTAVRHIIGCREVRS